MVITHTNYKSFKQNQVPDGTNDYYVGIDGTNSFTIAPLAGIDTMVFNILIKPNATIDLSTAVARIMEISNSARTALFAFSFGAFSGSLTNEYLGGGTTISGTNRLSGLTDGSTISAGWHMLTFSVSPSVTRIMLDGNVLAHTDSASGRPITISTGYTADRVSLMATTAGGAPTGCTWREAAFIGSSWTGTVALALLNYYTRNGNVTLENTDRSIKRFMSGSVGYGQLLRLWPGLESGTDLIEVKSPSTGKLTKTGF